MDLFDNLKSDLMLYGSVGCTYASITGYVNCGVAGLIGDTSVYDVNPCIYVDDYIPDNTDSSASLMLFFKRCTLNEFFK